MLNFRKKIIHTPHGNLITPFFMPDATRGFIKLLNFEECKKVGIKAMVVNTYHLYLQPGLKTIVKSGGIHKFMNWNGPLLSDSGGYQVFSLVHKNPKFGKILDDKVIFRSPLDGSQHELTPEKSIQIQFDLGVDMMVCLDDCPPNNYSEHELKKSVDRTIFWAKRCKLEYLRQLKKRKIGSKKKPLLFSVIQGGNYQELRKYYASELIKINFDGYGFGARPIDSDGNFNQDIMEYTAKLIPEDKIRFALGVGLPDDIIKSVKLGWDMFDCVIPTREGRHGRLFQFYHSESRNLVTRYELEIIRSCLSRQVAQDNRGCKNFYNTYNICNAKFAKDFSLINKKSKVIELREYSKAYLHHLFKLKEPLGSRLASLNNLEFYLDLLNEIRNTKE